MERHISNTLKLAEWLERHPLVSGVNYPGLKSNSFRSLAQKYFPRGAGGVLSFVLDIPPRFSRHLVEKFGFVSHLANVGDARTLIIQPASTTHSQLDEKARAAAGVSPGMFRVSVGLEHIDDIIADFEQAIDQVRKEAAV
jgi:O-acetylhomoserine (thiol)-lyase